MERILSFIAAIALFFLSCSNRYPKNEIIITCNFQNAAGEKVILSELLPTGSVPLDSSRLSSDGTFTFRIKPESAGFYLLEFPIGFQIPVVSDKGEMIRIEADLDKKPFTYSIEGSPGSSLLKEFFIHTEKNLAKVDSLTSILRQYQDTPEFYQMTCDFDPFFKKIMDDQKEFESGFIIANKYSLASLIALNYKLGLMPVLTPESDSSLFFMLDTTLSARYPQNKHVIFHHQRLMGLKR